MSSSESDSDSDKEHSDEAGVVSENELQNEEAEAEKASRKEERDLKRKAVKLTASDDDNSDDVEDDAIDSEEDEELHPSHRRKKKRRHGVKDYFIDEAEVDDDGEEEDDEEIGVDGDLMAPEDEEADEWGPSAPEIDSRRRLEDIMNRDEDEIEQYYKSRYEETNIGDRFGGGEGMVDDITQQGNLPGVKDPNLWVVRCRHGEEKATVIALMRKMLAYQYSDEPMQIKSALTKEGLRGYIYVEAYKQTHVKQAIDGIGSLAIGKWAQKMVAIKEMTDVMRVVKETARLHPKQWIRLKRSIYKGDLAQVEYVEDAQNMVSVRILPRINYSKKRGVLRTTGDDDDQGRKAKRPAQALFNTDRIRACGGEYTTDGDHYLFEGNRYDSDGFLHKSFNMNAIIVDGVKPTLAELEKFNESPENVRLNAAVKKGPGEVEHSFAPGDDVEVCEGELNNLHGKVLSVDGNQIIVLPSHNDLKEPIAFQPSELKKHFEQGKHVKVIAGRYENDTGLVIRVENNVAMILSDLTMSEIKVAPKDLQLCQERATGVDSTGHFQFGDLIQVDPQTVGVIVRLEKELFEVLTIQNKVIRLKQNVVLRRRETKNAQAYDFERRCIQAKDIVQVCDGPHSGLQGEIRHIYRSWAFIHSRMFTENGGLFVARTRHLSLRGGGAAGGGPGGLGKPLNTAAGGGYAPQSPRLSASPAHPSQGGGDVSPGGGGGNRMDFGARGGGMGGRGGRGQKNRQDKQIIGQTVRVIRGVLKGNIGIVKDVTETEFSVELHYPYKTVLVKKENVGVTDSSGQIVGARFGASTGRATPTFGGRTPMHGGQTPMYGSRTPMYGSQTPMHDGSRTPHYGSQTPRPDSGGQTPRATAFDPAGATPAHHGMGSGTPGTSGHDALFESSPGGSSSMGGAMSSPIGGGSIGLGSQGPFTPLTPAGGLLHGGVSPMSSPASVRTPDIYQPSPGGMYSPMGSVAPYTPATPGGLDISGGGSSLTLTSNDDGFGGSSSDVSAGMSDRMEPVSGSYLAENTIVQVALSSSSGAVQRAVIKSTSGANAAVQLLDDDRREVTVPIDQVFRQEPEGGDSVRVIVGNNVLQGNCLSVDNGEGVIKLSEGTLKLFSLKFLIPYYNPDKVE